MTNYQTVKIAKSCHPRGPETGACVMEVVSLLAGEDFSDCPACVHPELALLMRTVNDILPDEERQALMQYTPRFIGTNNPEGKQIHRDLWRVFEKGFASVPARPLSEVEQDAARAVVAALDEYLPFQPTVDDLAWENLNAVKEPVHATVS